MSVSVLEPRVPCNAWCVWFGKILFDVIDGPGARVPETTGGLVTPGPGHINTTPGKESANHWSFPEASCSGTQNSEFWVSLKVNKVMGYP